MIRIEAGIAIVVERKHIGNTSISVPNSLFI